MARILNKIVYSTTPPQNENDLWICRNVFYMYKAGEWVPVKQNDASLILELKYFKGTNKLEFYYQNYSYKELEDLHKSGIGIIVTFGDGKYYYPEVTYQSGGGIILKCDSLNTDGTDPILTEKKIAIARTSERGDAAMVTTKKTTLQSKLNLSTINGKRLDTGEDILIEGTGGGSTIVVENKLDINSSNPVQNKVITEKFNEIETILTWNNYGGE